MKNILNVNKASLKATLMSSIIVFSTFTFCSAITNKVACADADFKEITLDEWHNMDLDYINHDLDPEFNEWLNYEKGQDPEFVDVNRVEEVIKDMKETRDSLESERPKNRQEGLAMAICLANDTDFIFDQVKRQESGQQEEPDYGQEIPDHLMKYRDLVFSKYEPYLNKSVDELKSQINKEIEKSKSSQQNNQQEELDYKTVYLETFYNQYKQSTDEFLNERENAIKCANERIESYLELMENGIHTVTTNPYSKEDGENWEKFNSLFQEGGTSNPEENQLNLSKTESQNDEYEYYEEEEEEEALDSTENQPTSYNDESQNEEAKNQLDEGSSCNVA